MGQKMATKLMPVGAGALMALFLLAGLTTAAAPDTNTFEMESAGSYVLRPGDTKVLAETLAIFKAKRAAVEAAGKFFSRHEQVEFYGQSMKEIVNIAADNIAFERLQEEWKTSGENARIKVRVKLVIAPRDFIEAADENRELEKKFSDQTYREEMEPAIPVDLLPGHDIAAAYRLIRKQDQRIAVIYLDRLQKKYPNWSEVYDLKALAYDQQHEFEQMQSALRKACALGSQAACNALKTARQANDSPN